MSQTISFSFERTKENLSSLFENEATKDFTIFCNNNRKLKVHKLFLIANSPVFETMLKGDFQEKNEVTITDIKFEILLKLVHIMYMRSISLDSVYEAAELYSAAEKYDVQDARKLALDHMSSACNFENCYFLMEQALLFNEELLKNKCKEYFSNNCYTVMRYFLNNRVKDGVDDEILANFLDQENACAYREIDLYQMLESLIARNLMTDYSKSLSHIRFLLMPAEQVLLCNLLSEEEKAIVVANIEALANNKESKVSMPEHLSTAGDRVLLQLSEERILQYIHFWLEIVLETGEDDMGTLLKRIYPIIKRNPQTGVKYLAFKDESLRILFKHISVMVSIKGEQALQKLERFWYQIT